MEQGAPCTAADFRPIAQTHWRDYNCEAYALQLAQWSQLAARQIFANAEEARQWIGTKIKELEMAPQGSPTRVYFWYPTKTTIIDGVHHPVPYHWAREISGCDPYIIAAKLGASEDIFLYKSEAEMKEHSSQVYPDIHEDDQPIMMGLASSIPVLHFGEAAFRVIPGWFSVEEAYEAIREWLDVTGSPAIDITVRCWEKLHPSTGSTRDAVRLVWSSITNEVSVEIPTGWKQ